VESSSVAAATQGLDKAPTAPAPISGPSNDRPSELASTIRGLSSTAPPLQYLTLDQQLASPPVAAVGGARPPSSQPDTSALPAGRQIAAENVGVGSEASIGAIRWFPMPDRFPKRSYIV
jgi:hypothetical protein